MGAQKLLLCLTAAYFAFHLARALWTGNASFFRKHVSTRSEDPKYYWGFLVLVGFGAAVAAYGAHLPYTPITVMSVCGRLALQGDP